MNQPHLSQTNAAPNAPEEIVAALRSELLEYGGLLNLFEEQEDAILSRKPDCLGEITSAIRAQSTALHSARSRRESIVATLVPAAAAHLALLQTIPLFPQPMRPLVSALAWEIKRLIRRVRHRAAQVRALLARTLALPHEVSA